MQMGVVTSSTFAERSRLSIPSARLTCALNHATCQLCGGFCGRSWSHVQVILEGQEIPIRPGKVNVFEALAVFLWLVNERHDGFLKEIDILKGMCLDEVFDDNRGLGGLQHAI